MSSSASSTSPSSADPDETFLREPPSRGFRYRAPLPLPPGPSLTDLLRPRQHTRHGQNQQNRDEYTVHDFLREGTTGVLSEEQYAEHRRQAIVAMDRKRRLTGSTHDGGRRRTHSGGFHERHSSTSSINGPLRLDGSSSPNNQAGHVRSGSTRSARPEVIDLTGSSPELRSRPLPAVPREESTNPAQYVLPRWQPDNEVSECPICKRQFTFLFRRHHCRKCGRVVCNDCSPHRITIPRQFIVSPPGPPATRPVSLVERAERVETVDLTGEDNDSRIHTPFAHSPASPSGLGGGEKVRLCNPCVPDPQPSPVHNYRPRELLSPGEIWRRDQGLPPLESDRQAADVLDRMQTDWQRAQDHQRSRGRNLPLESESIHTLHRPRNGQPDGLSHYGNFDYNLRSNDPRRPGRSPMPLGHDSGGQRPPSLPGLEYSEIMTSRNRHSSSYHPPAHSRFHSMDLPGRPSLHGSRPRGSSMFDGGSRHIIGGSSSPRNIAAGPARPRLRESDMCPICFQALPPRGSNGDETARESHIMHCIDSGINPRQETSSSAPGGRQALMQLPSRAPIQMLPFVATEKDCLGEEGNPQECSICMEEYNVGDQLARLECLCRFHHECIVEWFGRKQECPLHKIA